MIRTKVIRLPADLVKQINKIKKQSDINKDKKIKTVIKRYYAKKKK